MAPSAPRDPAALPWWQRGVVYQIYPRSFQDTTGDGVGDLAGVEARLDHLVDLGVDAIWLSPIFPSPMLDFGYDISDYCDIDPIFGTLADFDRLVAAAHGRGLKVLLDLVPSHTSHLHPWFEESRASAASAKRDWYVWRDAAPDGGPPTNWVSEFGGPAWTWDEATGQYYLHIYLREQPALNWHNAEVQAALADVMRFWFERGVDGFRVDAAAHLAPDPDRGDNPPNPDWRPELGPARRLLRAHSAHQPAAYAAAKAMRRVADDYPGRVLMGEAYGTLEEIVAYYGDALDGFHLPFNFALVAAPWDARFIATFAEAYEAALPPGAWPNWVLGNHDRQRIASRVGPAQARVAMMLLLTLRGTPTLYQGDELGLADGVIPPAAVQDPWEKNVPGQGLGRDPVRTPMPWGDGPGRGFTRGAPWLPLTTGPSVESQRTDAGSILNLTRALTALRRAEPALAIGDFAVLSAADDVLMFARSHGERRLVVALNLSSQPRALPLQGRVLLSTHPERSGVSGPAELLADEGVVLIGG